MTMVHIHEVFAIDDHDVDAVLTMAVGAGSVDPRLIEPGRQQVDVEELIAFRTSSL